MSRAPAPWLAYAPLHVPLGEFRVGSDAGSVVTTLLGSCVAACIFDPEVGVGGLNHFLLPDGEATLLFGSHSMEMLVNAVIKSGARRKSIIAKAFGGAQLKAGTSVLEVGRRNVEFVRKFLANENFPLIAQDLGGPWPRRIWLHPTTGKVWVERLQARDATPLVTSETRYQATLAKAAPAGEIDLFD